MHIVPRSCSFIDLDDLIDEARETTYSTLAEAQQIATQLANVLSYSGAFHFPLRYLRGRIIVTYSFHPSNYLIAVPIRCL